MPLPTPWSAARRIVHPPGVPRPGGRGRPDLATSDDESEDLAQTIRDALYQASRYPQFVLPGVGSIAHFDESSAPTLIPSDTEDHDTYRYQATYTIHTRP